MDLNFTMQSMAADEGVLKRLTGLWEHKVKKSLQNSTKCVLFRSWKQFLKNAKFTPVWVMTAKNYSTQPF